MVAQPAVSITLPDGTQREFPAGLTVKEIAERISPGLARRALVAKVNGEPVDLSRSVNSDVRLEILTARDPETLEMYRHSSAHLLAAAVLELFPEAKCGVGPPIEDGFFYDFQMARPFTPEDLEAIEQRMKEIVKRDVPYRRVEIPKKEAMEKFREMGQDLKLELVEEKGEPVVSCYWLGNFFDFCRGPHIPASGHIKALKVLGSSGAYWKGDERNRPVQRIYATSFYEQKQLDEHLHRVEEAKRRDHRKLGRELGIFAIESEAPGQVFWLPNGWRVVSLLIDYLREKLERRGYLEIRTPLILDEELWRRTGHLDHYKDNMFFVERHESEGSRFGIKPMNCPGAAIVYRNELRSYRDLPLRLAEFGHCHRFERSGVLSGLTRVRAFLMDDAHIYCTLGQVQSEVEDLMDLVHEVYGELGFEGVRVELSTRPESSIGTGEQWEQAEAALQKALESKDCEYGLNPGEGAFYGPKIDFNVRDALGRTHQCGTIQLDFFQSERFDLHYAAEDGSRQRPVLIHRAILGSFERFIAVLIEHTAGAFPFWLAPLQTVVLPIAERHHEYARQVTDGLREEGIRVKLDARAEKTGYKIRDAQLKKIPFMLVLGDREQESKNLSVRNRSEGDQGTMELSEFIRLSHQLVEQRALVP
ncbi:MAG TPA: threonine--tRNA ligase [Vicinamibacteria bacterium]|nr:threonine--tRNA ligase [Vicinamibacteria bacterium]